MVMATIVLENQLTIIPPYCLSATGTLEAYLSTHCWITLQGGRELLSKSVMELQEKSDVYVLLASATL